MKTFLHIIEATLYASVWIVALSLVLTGCGGNAHATPAKIEPPTIIIHSEPAPPLAEVTTSHVAPPAVIADTIFPPKAAVKIDADTYRACTCGDVCTCANCPSDCNLVARGDCPGGVCLMPQRSVLTRSTVNHAGTASGDCDSGACGGLRKAALAPVRFVREKKPVRKAGGFVWRLFRRGG